MANSRHTRQIVAWADLNPVHIHEPRGVTSDEAKGYPNRKVNLIIIIIIHGFYIALFHGVLKALPTLLPLVTGP